jgi:cellulose biosynthesis protein BcsQ
MTVSTAAALPGRVVMIASGKGGTGKSTLALALADVWAAAGYRVALVDADPQAGATTVAGLEPVPDPLTAAPVAVHGLALYPSGRPLALADAHAHASRLQRAAQAAELVVVDLGPALTDAAHTGALSVAALMVVAARTDAAGLRNVEEAVSLAASAGVPVAVVPTFATGTGLSRETHAFLRGRYPTCTEAAVPMDARAADAAGVGRPVTRTARRSRVAQAVHTLAAELADTLKLQPVGAP